VAGLKIARLVLVYGFAIAVVVPLFAAMMGEMMEKTMSSMPQRAGGPPPAAQFGQGIAMFYGFALSAGAVLMVLVGMIYPLIMLWVLTRPKVKAACGDPTAARSPELS
ncbi:MAG: hypothetical protein JNG90_00030, partial [Planctomycetaceae bacterium]|nr:hypothetical protein [Planctomycetaceae bacterium]